MELNVNGVCFCYGSREILHDVELEAKSGEVLAVIGANGAGKSTLIRCINRILKPQKGTVFLDGKELSSFTAKERACMLGYVPQTAKDVFSFNVMETVLMGRKPHISWGVGKKDLKIVNSILLRMGLKQFVERYLYELSGGERQKVLIARALAQEPEVLLLDEPTSNLDVRHQLEVMELIQSIAREQKKCVIIVVHDLNLAARFADKILMLKGGVVFAAGKAQDVLTTENIKDVYGVDSMIINTKLGPYVITVKPSDSQKESAASELKVAAATRS
ncbi:MAG TPA: ABC transporter ATP-binding protein [Syntrophomonadaceae bacterium]|jgi:iron complex transport system ATP-binding protein|nr:ABC transporter ATP-binding protein [Thermoanaerobacterales bacterium]HAF17201.1 ABC transporter ATP-binding protein [Peptococcaceae bacterium]HHW29949.1 ABC transporter ATP-binding protein [Syntrophomonadaceae bacterium]